MEKGKSECLDIEQTQAEEVVITSTEVTGKQDLSNATVSNGCDDVGNSETEETTLEESETVVEENPQKASILKNKKAVAILCVVAVIFFGSRIISGVGQIFSALGIFDSGYSTGQSDDSMYMTAAKEILEMGVRSAGSPIFNRYKVFEEYNIIKIHEKDDYGRAIVFIDVTARAGDETRREEYYVFVNEMTSDGQYSYDPVYHATSSIGMLEIFKSANNFGEAQ